MFKEIFDQDYAKYSKEIKGIEKKYKVKNITELFKKFNSIIVCDWNDRVASFKYVTVAYVYEQNGNKYAVDIYSGDSFKVVENNDSFRIDKSDLEYIRGEKNFAYLDNQLSYDFFKNLNQYDIISLKEDFSDLEDLYINVRGFIKLTNDLELDRVIDYSSYLRKNADYKKTVEYDIEENVMLAEICLPTYCEYNSKENPGRKRKTKFSVINKNEPVVLEEKNGILYGRSLIDKDFLFEVLDILNKDLSDEQYYRIGKSILSSIPKQYINKLEKIDLSKYNDTQKELIINLYKEYKRNYKNNNKLLTKKR